MNRNQVQKFEILFGQLEALQKEISTVSASAPEHPADEFKFKLARDLLGEADGILEPGDKPVVQLHDIETAEQATYSDLLVALSLYVSCLQNYRARHVKMRYGKLYWVVNEQGREAFVLMSTGRAVDSA